MKNFILLICSLMLLNHVDGNEYFPFQKRTLQELIKSHIAQSTWDGEDKIVMTGFESVQRISDSEDTIIAFNQTPANLKILKQCLKQSGVMYVFYMPRESHHWRVTEEINGESATLDILEKNEYRKAVENLGMKVVSSNFSKGLAFYPNLDILNSEFVTKPSLWNTIGELKLGESKWLPNGYCFLSNNNESVIGYYLIEFVLQK